MANVNVKVSRSDLYPVGTLVGAYDPGDRQNGSKPVGTANTSATVDAAGLLTIAIPEKSFQQLWAEVAGEHRYLRISDPTPAPPPGLPQGGPLPARVDRRQAANGVSFSLGATK